MKYQRITPLLLGMMVLLPMTQARAADYQFSIPTDERDGRAFLWIPPTCRQVRGLLLAPQVILEKRVCDDPIIRAACARENLGILILFRGPFGEFHYHRDLPRDKAVENILDFAAEHGIAVEIKPPQAGSPPASTAPTSPRGITADQSLQKTLDELAAQSGYPEIAAAPLLTLGHSGGAIFAWNVAYCWPQRALGVIGLHAAAILPPPWDPKASPATFPALCISGEYESWGSPKEPLDKHWRWLRGNVLNMRSCYDAQGCEIVQPGGTHFNWDTPLANFVALFIEKTAHYRIPEGSAPATPLKVLPLESGWLTDITVMTPRHYAPAPYKDFKGDPALAFWHMDEELAQAAERFTQAYAGATDQRITFVQDDKPIPASWIEAVRFAPIDDGMTVKLAADFLSQTPQGVLGAGQSLSHAPGPIKFRLIGGWGGGGVQTGPDTFRIRFDHFGLSGHCCNLQVMAYHEGDATYKYAEQPCQIVFPEKNTRGKPQTITFPALANIKTGTAPIVLQATADSGLPVSYFVRSGPAEIKGNTLVLAPLPPKVRFPVRLTIVAYQWGRPIEPLVQTAKPVEQTIQIEKP